MELIKKIQGKNRIIDEYNNSGTNIDKKTVESFGAEWTNFGNFGNNEIDLLGNEYFDILDEKMINKNTTLADFGCGSGRFSKFFQGKVKSIYAIDPSEAVLVADINLGLDENVKVIKASISDLPIEDGFFDFGMSIGVLHHIPDTQQAMLDCIKKIKKGGYFFVYLYYSLDNRGFLFKLLWKLSNILRFFISALPQKLKHLFCEILAIIIYLPFVYLTRVLKAIGLPKNIWTKIPLSIYHNKSFFVIRNDSLDRFGTPLEHRFSKVEIELMMKNCGLTEIDFSNSAPFWRAVGKKA